MARDDNQGDTPDRVQTIIVAHLDVAHCFAWDAELKRDLGADSLDTIELTMALEDEFGVEIDDDTAFRWRVADDVLASVRERV